MSSVFAAPTCPEPIKARVHVPGSKSITNRALILAALSEGPSTITGALRSRDTNLMIDALRNLGTDIVTVIPDTATGSGRRQTEDTATTLRVTPHPLHGGHVYCGLAGTLMRFLPGVAALAQGDTYFDSDAQARQRPLATVLDGLRDLGVSISSSSLPFTVHGTGTVQGGELAIDASASSQFISGLLLVGARFTNGLHLRHSGEEAVPSQPHLDMTVDMLARHGVQVDTSTSQEWSVPAGPIAAYDWAVEPDLSNATPFLAAAAVTGGSVTVADWPTTTTQPGDAIRHILSAMGCTVKIQGQDLTVTGPAQLTGVDLDMHSMGELAPTVAALACCASTPTILRGIAHLRGHETNRLSALVTEITQRGGKAQETADGIHIAPAPLEGGLWHSYADHRMATAGAIIGLTTPGITVEDIETTGKTLPGFAQAWTELVQGAAGDGSSTTEGDRCEQEVWL